MQTGKVLTMSGLIIAFATGAMAVTILVQPSELPAHRPIVVSTPSELPTPTELPTPSHPAPSVTPSPTRTYVHRPPSTGGPLPSSTTGEDGGNSGGNPASPLPPLDTRPKPSSTPR